MTTNFIAAYASGIFDSVEAQAADQLIEALRQSLEKASECVVTAKKALFAVKSHNRVYQDVLKQKSSSRRRAIIDKNSALTCNYQAAEYGFRYFGNQVLRLRDKLAALMPELAADARRSAGNSRINDGRLSNTVVCHRLIETLPEQLKAMHADFAPEQKELIWHASGHLSTLQLNVLDHTREQDYAAPLSLPYFAGVCDRPAFLELDRCLQELATVVGEGEGHRQEFDAARSRALNKDQLEGRLSMATSSEQTRLILAEADASLIHCRSAYLATDLTRSQIFKVMDKCKEALKIAKGNVHSSREDSESGLYNVLGINIIAAQCLLLEAGAVRRKLSDADEIYRKTPDLLSASYAAMDQTFKARPASYERPFLDFLVCH